MDGDQLLLPLGCPPSCIVSIDDSDPRPYQAVDNEPRVVEPAPAPETPGDTENP